jgi:hypothetical protein
LNLRKIPKGMDSCHLQGCVPFCAIADWTSRHAGRNALKLLVAALFGVCLLASTASAQNSGAGSSPVSDALRAQLTKLVPDPLPGEATPQSAPTFYAANLWEYIDGAADQYQLYGLEGMLHQEFAARKINVTLDIFSLGKNENAFGIYATERSTDAPFLSIGTEGYHTQSSDGSSATLNFFLDRYYVKLQGFGTGSSALLESFARNVASRIGATPEWPEILARLPAGNRIPHSELYVLQSPLGHDFLSPAYSIKYKTGTDESSLVISVAKDKADALRRLELLEKHLSKNGKCAAAPELGDKALRGSTSYEGEMVANVSGRYLVLMLNPTGNATAIFHETLTKLK